jgi:sec-independent protein translocase protein TatC
VTDIDLAGRGAIVPAGPRDVVPADGEGAVMPLVDHLAELRRRLIVSVAALAIASVVGWLLEPRLLDLLVDPVRAQTGSALRFIGLGDAFFIRIKIALIVGAVLALPVVLWQAWSFIAPGLTRRERSLARPWLPLAYVFFLVGAAVAYVVLPFAVQFLLSFSQPGELEPLITAGEYFGFVTNLVLAFGLVMQYPLLVTFLAEIGVVTSRRLRSSRRIVLLAIAIFAAAITPGGDLVSPTVLGAVLYVLYELTIQLIRWRGH